MDNTNKSRHDTPVGTWFSLVQIVFVLITIGWLAIGIAAVLYRYVWLSVVLAAMGIGYAAAIRRSTIVYKRGDKGLAWFLVVGGGLLTIFASLFVCAARVM